ncbi:MAG TPA: glutathione S-transferase family protein [Gammaproteobacteria bacterium]|nr:glutathione S-transferase family protein [Gammaproteobacteria bacterium]
MNKMTLVIGNKNYSSWSLRPWLVLKQSDIDFTEIRLSLSDPLWPDEIKKYSPSRLVPVLINGELGVWDSLAICEYIAELFPAAQLWPVDVEARAVARSVSAEMHSGFTNLRKHMNMNCRGYFPGKGMTPEVQGDINRIVEIWNYCRARFAQDGEFLFGKFSIADAMYAPVTFRFATYAVALGPEAQAYVQTIQRLPAIQEWLESAKSETEVIAEYEQYKSRA